MMEDLMREVLEQIGEDIIHNDFDALEELLSFVPAEKLQGYLVEVKYRD